MCVNSKYVSSHNHHGIHRKSVRKEHFLDWLITFFFPLWTVISTLWLCPQRVVVSLARLGSQIGSLDWTPASILIQIHWNGCKDGVNFITKGTERGPGVERRCCLHSAPGWTDLSDPSAVWNITCKTAKLSEDVEQQRSRKVFVSRKFDECEHKSYQS